jgi:hypothetical protein
MSVPYAKRGKTASNALSELELAQFRAKFHCVKRSNVYINYLEVETSLQIMYRMVYYIAVILEMADVTALDSVH